MRRGLVKLIGLMLLASGSAAALPFNDDMVDNQYRTGTFVRQRAKDSVPVGSLAERLETKDDAKALVNPLKGDATSAASGERLFQINCFPCHGDIAKSPYVPGPVGKFLPGPDLSVAVYHDTPAGRTDGQIFGVIEFGNVLMPPVGYKLSAGEQWDIVNYIRKVQASKAQ